jgi:hypothetical protein
MAGIVSFTDYFAPNAEQGALSATWRRASSFANTEGPSTSLPISILPICWKSFVPYVSIRRL